MLSQTSVLEPDEHDQLGKTIINLMLGAPLYGSTSMQAASAKNLIEMIDLTRNLFVSHGLMMNKPKKLWPLKFWPFVRKN